MQLPTAENPPDNIVSKDRWGKNQWEVAQELLREQGLTKLAGFQESPEGEYLPAGPDGAWLETMRWFILTPDEMVRSCMLDDWDENKTAPDGSKGYYILRVREWPQEEVATEEDNPDYMRARKELDLPLTEEQQKILQKWEEEHKTS